MTHDFQLKSNPSIIISVGIYTSIFSTPNKISCDEVYYTITISEMGMKKVDTKIEFIYILNIYALFEAISVLYKLQDMETIINIEIPIDGVEVYDALFIRKESQNANDYTILIFNIKNIQYTIKLKADDILNFMKAIEDCTENYDICSDNMYGMLMNSFEEFYGNTIGEDEYRFYQKIVYSGYY